MFDRDLEARFLEGLDELDGNNGTKIGVLTQVAADECEDEPVNAPETISHVLKRVLTSLKQPEIHRLLPTFYVLDSILKTCNEKFRPSFQKHFSVHIVQTFQSCYRVSTPKIKRSLSKLVETWDGYFDRQVLNALKDFLRQNPPPSEAQQTEVHLNPDFFNKLQNTHHTSHPHSRPNHHPSYDSRYPTTRDVRQEHPIHPHHHHPQRPQQRGYPDRYNAPPPSHFDRHRLDQPSDMRPRTDLPSRRDSYRAPGGPRDPQYLSPYGKPQPPLHFHGQNEYGYEDRFVAPPPGIVIPKLVASAPQQPLLPKSSVPEQQEQTPKKPPPLPSPSPPPSTPQRPLDKAIEKVTAILCSKNLFQCSQCGFRLQTQSLLDDHLDWHIKSRHIKEVSGTLSRSWNLPPETWVSLSGAVKIEAEAEAPETTTATNLDNKPQFEDASVEADEDQSGTCPLCGEEFQQFWHDEEEIWKWKPALRRNYEGENLAVHPKCWVEYKQMSEMAQVLDVKLD